MATNKLKLDIVESKDNYAKFALYPFERGYGNTFANPIRRILISSIKGTSITKVKIKGLDHEYSTLKGVKEDGLRIILNLQKIVFKLTSSESEKVTLKAHGKGTITAGDLKVPGNVEIINPDVEIATLSDDGQLEIEAVVEVGYGFQLANEEIRNSEPGTIPLNKSFAPIEKVNYNIEPTRVAHDTELESAVFEIWTNGVTTPLEAFKEALNTFNQKAAEVNDVVQSFSEEANIESEE